MDGEAGGGLDRVRVSDQEREAVVERLNSATAEGRLTLEEFTERAGHAYAARTGADLAKLVDDLPATTRAPAVPEQRGPATEQIPIGTLKRDGRWRLERDTRFEIVLGTAKLDLRRAELGAAEVTLHVRTVLGSIKVWVPHGVRVQVEGQSVVGTRKITEDAPTSYGGPLLRLVLDTVVGSVKVYRV